MGIIHDESIEFMILVVILGDADGVTFVIQKWRKNGQMIRKTESPIPQKIIHLYFQIIASILY